MDMAVRGAGAGGKAGGAGGGISEEPDTLSSVAYARFVEAIGEGPIVGLVNNEYSIFLDGVPLRELEGTPNYRPFKYQTTLGTQSQLPIPGFSGTQSEIEVGLHVSEVIGRVVRSVPDADADSVRVTVSVNGLSQTTPDGKVGKTSIAYDVSIRVAAGTWTLAVAGLIDGKTGSKYQRSHEIPLADLGPGPYEVSVQRTTPDSTSALLVNDLYWDSYTVINYEQLAYPNTALVALELDARYFSAIPARTYHVKGLIIQVPKNYDPVTRVYATTGPGTTSGGWDGTFKPAYSNNPAWCFYDLVVNTRYGLGKRIGASQISKWQIYAIGQYCDQLVPTGGTSNVFENTSKSGFSASGSLAAAVPVSNQNMEPRFTLNCVLNSTGDAYKVLNQLASVFRGMSYWGAGQVALTQDRPTAYSMIYNNANVIDGMFNYQGSSRAERHTTAMVGWNDPSDNFRQKFEYIEDRDGIARYGIRSIETIAFGCTSRSQARRLGLWLLYTERYEKDLIQFSPGLDTALVEPGDVVQILDANRAGVRWGGRVLSATTAAVTIDAPIDLAIGTYTLAILAVDGTIVEKAVNITTAGSRSVLTVALAYSVAPSVMTVWSLSSTTVTPMLARVVDVKADGLTKFKITCIEHNPTKYAAIELGVGIIEQDYSFLTYDEVPVVQNLKATASSSKATVSSAVTSDISVSWDALPSSQIRGYVVKSAAVHGDSISYPEQSDPFRTIRNASPDTYTITVSAVNILGIVGPTQSVVLSFSGLDDRAPPTPTGVTVEAGSGLITVITAVPTFTVGHGYLRTNVYAVRWPTGGTEPVFSNADLILNFAGKIGQWPSDQDTRWCVWLTWQSVDGVESAVPAGGTHGYQVTTEFDVSVVIDALTGEITRSQLYIDLGTDIDRIGSLTGENDDAASVSLSAMVAGHEARKAGGQALAIAQTQLTTAIVEGLSAEAASRELLAVTLGDGTAASVQNERLARVSADEAIAQDVELVAASVDDVEALLANSYSTTATMNAAIVTATTTLQASVSDEISAAVSVEASARATLAGQVSAQYTIKLDVGNKVAGIGLFNDGATSAFGVRADQFYVAAPSGSSIGDVIPFIVRTTPTTINGVSVPIGVYMTSAMIETLSADKLTAGTITATNYIQSSNYVLNTSGWKIKGDGSGEVNNWVVRGNFAAGRISVGTAADSVVFYDSAAPTISIPSSATGVMTYSGDVGEAIVTGNNLLFKNNDSTWAFARRVATGPTFFSIVGTATVDHYFSLWYRINSGSWVYLISSTEPQDGYGSIAAGFGITLTIAANNTVQFGFSITDSALHAWDSSKTDIQHCQVTVQGRNF